MKIPENLLKHLDRLAQKNLEKWLNGQQLFQGWHGSPTPGFHSFDLSKAGAATHAEDTKWFPIVMSSSPYIAADYSLGWDAAAKLGDAKFLQELTNRANAALKAPFIQGGSAHINGIYPLIAKGKNVREIDAQGQEYNFRKFNEIAHKAYNDGIDMLIMRNFDDSLNANLPASDVAFLRDPSQVKSPNNSGGFAGVGKNKNNLMRTLAPLGVGTAAMAAALLGDGSEAEAAETSDAQNNGISANLLRSLGIGARDVLEGLGEGVGFVANPFANLLNAAAGGSPTYFSEANAGRALADLLGLPAAESDAEKFLGGISRGAASVLPTMGAGVALNAAKSAPLLANDLLASPRMQAAFGAGIGGFDQALRYLLDGD